MKKFLPFLLLIFTINSFSQKEANFWYFGNNAALDFNSGDPVPVTGSQLNTTEGCSSFSDADGNLLFYVGAPTPNTTNLTIWNKNNQPMPRGVGLQGDASSSQAALTIPAPGKPDIYYLFTVGAPSSNNQGFWYYTVDMTKDNGLGDIDSGPVLLSKNPDTGADLSFTWSEKVTAVRAKECNEFWVISLTGNTFYSYKVDENGVESTPFRSTLSNFSNNDARGYLKVSPDGTKIVSANMVGGTFLLDFNDETGEITNSRLLDLSGNNGYGVEFSLTSNVLYVSTGEFSNNSQEILFQFDVSLSNIDDINNSRYTVHTYTNTRGALQMGPDGKIYWTSNASNNISVIKRPDILGAGSNYSHQSVFLGNGVTASQGMPPFISSLLLPVELKDSDTNEIVNNKDLQYCTGESKTIVPDQNAIDGGTDITYEWYKGTTQVSIDPALTLSNLVVFDQGQYSLIIKLTDECGNLAQYNAKFKIEVYETTTANQPENINFCDTDNDGFNTFNLDNLKTNEILNGANPSIFEVFYYTSLDDANNNLNPISNSYTNTTAFSSQIIYARVQNIRAPNACFDIIDFSLTVSQLPIPQATSEYALCDNTSVGSDTDGFIDDFILSTKDAEILGNLDANQYNVTYHLNQSDADSNLNPIPKDTNYTNTTANSQAIFVRVENKDNIACFDTSVSFNLIVNKLPTVTNTVDLLQCDDNSDLISTFNLTEAEISISDNPTNDETFLYFETEADANAGTPEVADKLRYPVNAIGEAWVRTVSIDGCFRITKINLSVDFAGDVPYDKEFPAVCDDFLDREGNDNDNNDDTDGVTNFDFSEANEEILAFFPATIRADLEVSYYETSNDRTTVINEIPDISDYRNTDYPSNINRQTIYFRIVNKNNNNCNGIGELYLRTNSVPLAEEVNNLESCDDNFDGNSSNGIIQNFNLESQTATILGSQDPADFTVTYHTSALEANSGNNPLSSPFENTIRDSQTIFVRVTNNNTSCFTDHTTFNVIVNPLPIVNFVDDIEVCDDTSDGSARNGFSQSIDLEGQTAGILGSQDPTNISVTYHRSLSDAQSGTNSLVSPYENIIPNRETIYVRVLNSVTGCTNGISNFDVIINPEPTFEAVSNLSYCDDAQDGDDTNGIIQSIDLESQIPGLLGAAQDPDDFNVTFHLSATDASSGDNLLDSPYTNSNSTETIFVRIQNKRTSCINDDATFDIIVNPLPDFNVTSPQIVCLNILPLNIAVENPQDVYSYRWINENGEVISTNDNVDVSIGGIYSVTATMTNGTNCARTRTIQVNESIIASFTEDDVTIIEDSDNNSISINNVNGNLGIGQYEFALEDEDGNNIRNYQDDPLFENLDGGIYNILVQDKNGCGVAELLVSLVTYPKFFTPNNDGNNDAWILKGANLEFYPESDISIFNRFGKLVAKIPIDSQGWDGTYNGKLLPSDDYWFTITLIDRFNNQKKKTGHFSLLRR